MTVEPEIRSFIKEFVNSNDSVERMLAATRGGLPAAAALSEGLREGLGSAADNGFVRRYARNTVFRTMTRLGFVDCSRDVAVREHGNMFPKANVYRRTDAARN